MALQGPGCVHGKNKMRVPRLTTGAYDQQQALRTSYPLRVSTTTAAHLITVLISSKAFAL